MTYVADYITMSGVRLKNYRLETMCKHFGIELKAHDAMSDIEATKQLYEIIHDWKKA
jgi:DNA polymerase III epsilon subunit-like protein